MKKAQDFLVESTFAEKSFELATPKSDEEKIVLSIEEGAVPVSLLRDVKQSGGKKENVKSLFSRADEALRSLGAPKSNDKATFFRLLAIMINAGIPLIKALDTISDQTFNHKLRLVIYDLARDIEKGGTLSGSMTRSPDIFADSVIGMVRAGEAGGQLNKILKELAIEQEKNASISRKVKGAMIYPAFIISAMILVVIGMMVMVVPKIAEIFTQSDQELPLITRIVIGSSNFISNNLFLLFGAVIALVFITIGLRRTREGKQAIDWLLLHLPAFGPLLQKSILARFSRSLGNLLTSGVPIIQSLLINARGLGNEQYRKRVELASEDVARGIPLGESLRDSPEFPPMMVQMIAVGEQTAQLDTIAIKIAEYYEDEVDTAVASISKIIEPFILIFVGVVVGGIVAAIMMPIIQLTQISGAL